MLSLYLLEIIKWRNNSILIKKLRILRHKPFHNLILANQIVSEAWIIRS